MCSANKRMAAVEVRAGRMLSGREERRGSGGQAADSACAGTECSCSIGKVLQVLHGLMIVKDIEHGAKMRTR